MSGAANHVPVVEQVPLDRPRRRGRIDAATVLSWFLLVLFAIPAPMVVGALGTAGHPATIISIGAMGWWVWHHSHRPARARGLSTPVRWAAITFILVILVIYAHAMLNPLPTDETQPADSGLLRMIGAIGIVLISVDGLSSMSRVWLVARRLTIGAGLVALLAVIQYATGKAWVDMLSIPGLNPMPPRELDIRGDLVRPSATATNAIEFAVVMVAALPIAITVARCAAKHRGWYWCATLLISAGILLSISRTAIIGAAICLLVMLPAWSATTRAVAGVIGAGVLGATYFLVPGLGATFITLFSGASNDPSVQSRTDSYALAGQFISTHPWLGRGYGTFLPKYRILDNFYLQFLIEAGVVGMVALAGLIVTALWAGRTASRCRRLPDDARELSRACMASLAATAVTLAFFDALSFPESAGVLFLVIGLCGAVHHLGERTTTSLPTTG